MSDTDELIIIGHKIQAIRDQVTRSLDALAVEVAAKIPHEKTLRSNRPDPLEKIKKLVKKKKFRVIEGSY